MKLVMIFVVVLLVVAAGAFAAWNRKSDGAPTGKSSVLEFSAKTIDGETKKLSDYKGEVLLIVNTASECGNTPQYEGLEQLYRKYKDRGLRILAFPSNDFGGQEPGSDEEIKTFCTTKYDVTFDLFSKIEVKGDHKHPLYKYLTEESEFSGEVKWNFSKYLVDRNGVLKGKFASKTAPLSDEVVGQIESLLAEKAD